MNDSIPKFDRLVREAFTGADQFRIFSGAAKNLPLPTIIDFDLQLRSRAFAPNSLFAVRNGEKISGEALASGGASVQSDIVRRVLAGGASVVFNGIQNRFADVHRLALAVKSQTGYSVHVNAYLTPTGAQALEAHYDPYSVFVVQVFGTKSWMVGEDPAMELELLEGDVFFMRKATRHYARATSAASLHLTVAVRDETPNPGEEPTSQTSVESLESFLTQQVSQGVL